MCCFVLWHWLLLVRDFCLTWRCVCGCAGPALPAAHALATAAAAAAAGTSRHDAGASPLTHMAPPASVKAAAPPPTANGMVGASGAGPLVLSPRPRSEWELDPSKIIIGRRLAVGGFGEVFVAKYEGTLVAVKRLLATDSDTTQRFIDEVHMLARLRHPNLLLFMGYTLTPEPSIVTEFMSRGSLFHILRQAGDKVPEARMQRVVAVSVARGMAYLHSRSPPILHLDLKSPNVLVDDRWRVKIAGRSRWKGPDVADMGSGLVDRWKLWGGWRGIWVWLRAG